jgi:hypothetical protein
MRNSLTKRYILYFLIHFSFSYGQNVVQNVDWDINEDNEMVITYTLNPEKTDNVYKISVSITSDGGRTWFSPRSTEGDLGKQEGYGNKQITWDIFSDRDELEGDVYPKVEAEVYLPPTLIGLGISTGLPGILNYNMILGYNKINIEYSSGFKFWENECRQLSIGYGYRDRISFNIIIGAIKFIGEETYPTLYALNNNVYEYLGLSLKIPTKTPFYKVPISIEMGVISGDEEFYERIWQGYIQISKGMKIRF